MSFDLEAHRPELDALIAREKAKGGALIPVLHQAQEMYGYLPRELQDYIAEGLGVPQSTVYGVVTFYAFFTTKPRGRHRVNLCLGTACYVRGNTENLDRFVSEIGRPGGRDHARQALHAGGLPLHRHVQQGPGRDDRQERPRRGETGRRAGDPEPVRVAWSVGQAGSRAQQPPKRRRRYGHPGTGDEYAPRRRQKLAARGGPVFSGELKPPMPKEVRVVLRNCGLIDPTEIEEYIAEDGYFALYKALNMTPEQVIEEAKRSGSAGPRRRGLPGRHEVAVRPQRGGANARSLPTARRAPT